MKEDTGSDVNWISPVVAFRLKAKILDIGSSTEYVGITGTGFVARKKVELSLTGSSAKSHHGVFLIAPDDFPFPGIVVGKPFIKDCGHPHALFPEKETRESLLVMQKKATVRAATYRAEHSGGKC